MAKSGSYNRHDRFYQKAKADKFVARSVYKLDELDRRYTLLKKNQVVVDLGCAPGSWLQYLAEKVGRKGAVVGYDIVPVELGFGPRVVAHVADVTTLTPDRIQADLAPLLSPTPTGPVRVDALISDMAPKLTGIRDADQAKSVEMVGFALRLAQALLAPDRGVFVAKLFQGRDTDLLVGDVKTAFKEVKLLKPEATREGSREVFVLGRTLRREGRLDPKAWPVPEDPLAEPPEDPSAAPLDDPPPEHPDDPAAEHPDDPAAEHPDDDSVGRPEDRS